MVGKETAKKGLSECIIDIMWLVRERDLAGIRDLKKQKLISCHIWIKSKAGVRHDFEGALQIISKCVAVCLSQSRSCKIQSSCESTSYRKVIKSYSPRNHIVTYLYFPHRNNYLGILKLYATYIQHMLNAFMSTISYWRCIRCGLSYFNSHRHF